jgi:hypothetical protein
MFSHRDNYKLSPNFFPVLETGDNRWAPDHGDMWDVSVIVSVFAKLRKTTVSFVVSLARPHGTTRLPMNEFSLNLIFENLKKNLSRKFKFC